MAEDIRIETLKQALMESTIDPAERDALADDLEYAQTINGSKDPGLQGIKRITISNVRREMLAHKRMKKHESDCPFRRAGTDGATVGTLTTKTLTVLKALTPFRWPAAIAIFSPHAPDVANKIMELFK